MKISDITDLWTPISSIRNGRPGHLWPDGRWLPVVAGGDGEGEGGSGGSGGEGGSGGGSGSGSGGQGDQGGEGEGGGSGGSGSGGGEGGSGSGAGSEGDHGFPSGTPVAEMTEKQQAAYWKFQSRKHEARAADRKDYDDLKAKAGEYDKLVEASRTEQEKAVEQARTEAADKARTEEQAKSVPRLVDAEMRAAAAAAGVDGEKLKIALEPLDRTKFLTDDGDVDLEKVKTYVGSLAPASNGKGGKFPNLGQGRRGEGGGGQPSVQSGRDKYLARHGRPQNQTT